MIAAALLAAALATIDPAAAPVAQPVAAAPQVTYEEAERLARAGDTARALDAFFKEGAAQNGMPPESQVLVPIQVEPPARAKSWAGDGPICMDFSKGAPPAS